MTALNRITPIAVLLAVVALFGQAALAQTNRATFPPDFDKYVLYATYDRGSSKEQAFALPGTIAISKNGAPLPAGTRPGARHLDE